MSRSGLPRHAVLPPVLGPPIYEQIEDYDLRAGDEVCWCQVIRSDRDSVEVLVMLGRITRFKGRCRWRNSKTMVAWKPTKASPVT